MRKWLAICTAGLAGVLAAYAAFGYLAVEPLARHYLTRWVETEWNSRLEIGAVDVDPFALTLRVQSLRLARPDGTLMASLERLGIDLEWRSLVRAAWVVREVEATAPQVVFERYARGRSNWDDLLRAFAAGQETPTPTPGLRPRVRIEHLRVNDGALVMAGTAPARLALRLLEGHALSTWQDGPGRISLEASLAGQEATLRWNGSINAARQAIQGEIEVRRLRLAPVIGLIGPLPAPLTGIDGVLDLRSEMHLTWSEGGTGGPTRLALTRGQATWSEARAHLDLAQAGRGPVHWTAPMVEAGIEQASLDGSDSPDLRVQGLDLRFRDMALALPADGSDLGAQLGNLNLSLGLEHRQGHTRVTSLLAELKDLVLRDSNRDGATGRPVLARLAQGSLLGAWMDGERKILRADSLVLTGLQAQVVRKAGGGSLNWQAALEGAMTDLSPVRPLVPATATATSAPAGRWQVQLGRLVLDDARLEARDQDLATPAALGIRGGRVVLGDLSNDLSRPISLRAHLPLAQGGVIQARGRLKPAPVRADLQLALTGVDLRPLSPYLSQAGFLQLEGGQLDASGRLQLALGEKLPGSFTGSASVRQLALADTSQPGAPVPFLTWQTLSTPSLRLDLPGPRVHMQALRLVRPVGTFIIHEDGSLNVTHLRRPPADATAKPSLPADGVASAPSIAIERLSVDNASLQFADLTLRPPFGAQIDALSGVINGLSDDPATVAQVELDGRVEDYGSAQIRGAVQPFRATQFTDLRLDFRNLDMTDLTPYAGKFAGRRIESGRLSAELRYRVMERRLAAENKFVIRQLKLGERIDSPTALSLPLDLAIAVLEDSEGVIDLDIPVTGSLDDPDFSYGRIIWRAITNVLTRVVTAPFRALGQLLGARDGEGLQGIDFEAGSAVMPPPSRERLAKVAQVLAGRPALRLTIVPAFDPTLDTKALQVQALRRAVLEDAGIRLAPGERPGPLDLSNPRVKAAIERQLRRSQGSGAGWRILEPLRDAIRPPQPGDLERLTSLLEQLGPTFPVAPRQLEELARTRAQEVRAELVGVGRLPPERVEIAQEPVSPATTDRVEDATGVTVPLQLKAAGGAAAPERTRAAGPEAPSPVGPSGGPNLPR